MRKATLAAAFILLTGPAAWAGKCPRCGADHGSYTPPAKTVSARAQTSRQKGDRLMQEYHRKVQKSRSRPAASAAARPAAGGAAPSSSRQTGGVSQTLANLARARQAQVIRERASRVLKRKEERKAQKSIKTPTNPNTRKTPNKQAAAQQQEEEKVTAVLNGEEAKREIKRSAAPAAGPKPGSALEQARWVSESSVEAAGSGTDDQAGKRSGRGIDSGFITPVYAGDQPVRPAGASMMDLYRKKEKAMRESYLKRANEVIKKDKERLRKLQEKK